MNCCFLLLAVLASTVTITNALSSILFKEATTTTVPKSFSPFTPNVPSSLPEVEIDMPDFVQLFGEIERASPLARQVIRQRFDKGISYLDSSFNDNLEWKNIEKNTNNAIHQIDKIDNHNGWNAPLLRFRASIRGPCLAEPFAKIITDLEYRKRWDTQIHNVTEIITVHDLDYANIAMGFGRYGDCARLGIGHCQTKAGLGISPREQLTLCGIQEFQDGSVTIWGKELDDKQNYLFPSNTKREVRARSHIFSTTMIPNKDNDTFDVEYILQLEIGGKLPTWITTPIVIDSVKNMFKVVERYYADQTHGSELNEFLQQQQHAKQNEYDFFLSNRQGILMTP